MKTEIVDGSWLDVDGITNGIESDYVIMTGSRRKTCWRCDGNWHKIWK